MISSVMTYDIQLFKVANSGGVGLMTIFNMIAILPMGGQAITSLKEYTALRKKGEI